MGQYFSNEDLKSNIQKYNVDILGRRYSFYTDNGVFSKEKLDFGTRVLLENVPLEVFKGKVLDVGCGTKPYESMIPHTEYVGLEFDAPENRASKKADIFYDGLYFPLKDSGFDSILTTQVLEHVFEPEIFVAELNRVLKTNGKILLTVPFRRT